MPAHVRTTFRCAHDVPPHVPRQGAVDYFDGCPFRSRYGGACSHDVAGMGQETVPDEDPILDPAVRKLFGAFVRTACLQALSQRMHDASPPPVCMSGWLRAGQLEARHDGVDCLAVIKAMKKDSDEELERQSSPRRLGASRECGEVVTRVEASSFWVALEDRP